ncbi:MAG: DUF6883 domain-containing protein [Acidithiobacillus sp.]
MNLPGWERAFIDDQKLIGYCLNPEHPEGRHKARVFLSALGIGQDDWQTLRDALLVAVECEQAEAAGATGYGALYVLDFIMGNEGKSAVVRSVWMVRSIEDFPRLVSCYIHKSALGVSDESS